MKPRNRPLFLIPVATLAFAFAGQASAQGWIVGASLGQSELDGYELGAFANLKNDDSDTSLSVFGGYLFNDWFGLAGEYIDLGDAQYAAGYDTGTESLYFTDKLSASGIDVSAVFMKALGAAEKVTIFGSIGIFDFDQDVSWTYEFDDGFFVDSEVWSGTDSGTTTSYGLGFAVPFGDDGWGFHGEYKVFSDVGDTGKSGHEYDRNVFQFGIHKVLGGNGN